MVAQVKSASLNPLNITSVLSFLDNLTSSRYINSSYDGAVIWSFPHFSGKQEKATLLHCVNAGNKEDQEQQIKLTDYYKSL